MEKSPECWSALRIKIWTRVPCRNCGSAACVETDAGRAYLFSYLGSPAVCSDKCFLELCPELAERFRGIQPFMQLEADSVYRLALLKLLLRLSTGDLQARGLNRDERTAIMEIYSALSH